MSLKNAKSTLRKKMAEVLRNINIQEQKRQSEKVFQKLIKMPEYKSSKRISIYLSTNNEVDTLPILQHIFDENQKKVFVPRYRKNEMEMIQLKSMSDYDQLPLTKWKIKQPGFNEIRENALDTGGLDFIILPGMAFTKLGHRLGHGMGYYDKYLSNLVEISSQRPHVVALAFNEQVLDQVPTNELDFNVDLVISAET